MRFNTVDQWLEWQMSLHEKAIDMGLGRVRDVATGLGLQKIAGTVITVAGTNGKGSSVAGYENWLQQAGYQVASYTSPHLLSYNERIKHNQQSVSDEELCAAFDTVEKARGSTTLTYFEFGTLAALYLMQQWQPDYAILEVGLGGRLDAVNIIDADLVHLTPIGVDHQAWLGDDREQIGAEKAGVLRPGIPVVVSDRDPPRSVMSEVRRLGCSCLLMDRDYEFTEAAGNVLSWRCGDLTLELDKFLPGVHQAHNQAGVMAGLSCLLPIADYDPAQVRANFVGTRLSGRFEQVESPLECPMYLDVGHNQDAARVLATNLESLRQAQGKVVVLLGMLSDKQPEEFVAALERVVDEWWLLSLDSDRGLSAVGLRERINTSNFSGRLFEQPEDALRHGLSCLGDKDIMLVTGSFVTVEIMLRALSAAREPG